MDYITPTHQEILDILNQTNVQVIVDEHPLCYSRKYDGYVMSPMDPRNKTGRTMFLLCVETMQLTREDWQQEVRYTIAHEAIHIAQLCKSKDGYLYPLGFRGDVESEAFAVQAQPKETLRILKKYCL